MNASFGDIFNDGRLAIYKANISEPGVLVQGNDLWVPKEGAGAGEYDNLAPSLGVDLGGWSWGAQFGDLNNDGTLDLYLVNGYISAGERSSYWYDFSVIRGGAQQHHRRRAQLARHEGAQLLGYQRKRVWVNDGVGRFTEVAQTVGRERHLRRARGGAGRPGQSRCARRDRRQPGRPGAGVSQHGGPGRPLDRRRARRHREQPQRHRRARRVTFGGRTQRQDVLAPAASARRTSAAFTWGLGSAAAVDRVTIVWPSGTAPGDRAARPSTSCTA
jgi:hypothetical protein